MHLSELIAALIFIALVGAVAALEALVWGEYVVDRLRRVSPRSSPWRPRALAIHGLFLAGALCVLYGFLIEPYWLEVSRLDVPTAKLRRVSLRVVQISDTHCERQLRNEPRLAAIINALDPDVIVFTGDALNDRRALSVFKELLRSLRARLGKFAVRGNIDEQYHSRIDLFGDTGFRELRDETVELAKGGETFCVTGLGLYGGAEALGAVRALSRDRLRIVLHHYPAITRDLGGGEADLCLVGHTHGGQVRLPFYGALVTLSETGKEYEAGAYRVGDLLLYVNRGVGMEGWYAPRVRFWCRPEIAVFDIHPKDAKP